MGIQTNLLWKGRAYDSLENCWVIETQTAREVRSTVIGVENDTPFTITYQIRTNQLWETTYLELTTQLSDKRQTHYYERNSNEGWTKDGVNQAELNDCVDVDISLTPFTNTLAINRLNLGLNQSKEITVLYFDILEQKVRRVQQKYTRQSETEYKFENVPNDFEAVITVNKQGFVLDYPGLFESVYARESKYQF